MNARTVLRIAPNLLRQFTSNEILRNPTACACNTYTINNLAKRLQVRQLFQDANKYEVAEGRERIYYGVLTPQIRAVKWFSLTTSACTIMAQPFLFNTLYTSSHMALVVAACSVIGFFTFGTPFLLHYITKKYITHLDYVPDKKTYIASTVGFFCTLKEMEFTPEDVKVPEMPGMFTTFVAKGAPLFLDARLFEDPSHYAKIMGYDKPMDFKLYFDETQEVKKKTK